MTPADFAERTAQAQGLPPHVEDPVVLARIATLLLTAEGVSDAAA